jgi:tetratricopeptide (TPR) repeat protein
LTKARELDGDDEFTASMCLEIEFLDAAGHVDFERCIRLGTRLIDINRIIGNFTRLAANTANVGLTYMNLGRYSEALPYLSESRLIYSRQGNRLQVFDAMLNEGRILGALGEHIKALALLSDSWRGLNQANETHFSGVAQAVKARVLADRNTEEDRAEALTIVREHLHPERQSPIHAMEQILASLEVYHRYGMVREAVPSALKALEVIKPADSANFFTGELLAYSALILDIANHELAWETAERARAHLARLYGECQDTASRRGLKEGIRGYRELIKRWGSEWL